MEHTTTLQTKQEIYNSKMRSRHYSNLKPSKKKKVSEVQNDIVHEESKTWDDQQEVLDVIQEAAQEVSGNVADETLKKFLVSFKVEIKPLIEGVTEIRRFRRDFAVVDAPSYSSARNAVRAAFNYRGMFDGGVGDIKVTEMTDEQVLEYEKTVTEQKEKESKVETTIINKDFE